MYYNLSTDKQFSTIYFMDYFFTLSEDDCHRNHQARNSGADTTAAVVEGAAKALECQLTASLSAIHVRLSSIEARLSDPHANDALLAIHRDLEELRRRYHAGRSLWSDGESSRAACLQRALFMRVCVCDSRGLPFAFDLFLMSRKLLA